MTTTRILSFSILIALLIVQISGLENKKKFMQSSRNVKTQSPNKFVTLKSICTREAMMILAEMPDDFDGLIYARGFPLECKATGNNSRQVRLILDVSACGVKVVEKENDHIEYETTVYLQYDKTVQQAVDEQILVKCEPMNSQNLHKTAELDREILSSHQQSGYSQPQGKSLDWTSSDSHSKSEPERLNCWLDILRGNPMTATPVFEPLRVGEETTIFIKIQQKDGIDTRVVNCIGHDGTEESVQPLVDNNGCAVDEAIMPAFKQFIHRKTGHKWVHTSFSAFKFPDREYLHLKCFILVCKSNCPVKTCNKRRQRESLLGSGTAAEIDLEESLTVLDSNHQNSILNIIEVFNSVEVQAPGIEIETVRLEGSDTGILYASSNDEDGKFVCTSPTRLIVAFGMLVGIFIVATVMSAAIFFWSRQQRRANADSESVIRFPYSPCESYS